MKPVFDSAFCTVSYLTDRNLVFVEWRQYCELEDYRRPLRAALEVIRTHHCSYAADTRNGFENNPADTQWVAEVFMPTAAQYGCKWIYFIIDAENSLKDELEGQEQDSKNLMQFAYVTDIHEISRS